jgi:hypothetical protein
MRTRGKIITSIVLLSIAALMWWLAGEQKSKVVRENPDLLFGRAWIDAPSQRSHATQDPSKVKKTDFVHAFVVVDSVLSQPDQARASSPGTTGQARRSVPVGVFQRASMYRFEAERFDCQRNKQELSLVFPQSGNQARMRYRIEPCNDRPPFDLCLLLDNNPWGGPKKYYAERNPTQRSARIRRRLQSLLPAGK